MKQLCCTAYYDLEDRVFKNELREAVRLSIQVLPPRTEKILRFRFGIEEDKMDSVSEIGDYFGISRERVHGIINKAMRMLRHPLNAKKLYDYI